MIKRILFQLTLVAILLVLLTPSSLILAKERRISLVIGNGAYRSAPLRNPVNDAKDIADALRNLGFTLILKTNADQRTMEATIREFGEKLRLGGVGLFYFAGHGLQVNGRNYLMPIGADVETESEIKYETVDAGRVLGQMEDAGNGFNIIILDACRDNPFGRSFRTSEKGLVKMDAPTGSFLAYSTAPGSVAADGTGRNGLYTSMLLKHITTPGLELEKLFKYVRIEVASASGNKQVPWESSSLMGDFYFNTKRGIAVKSRPSYTGLEAERKQLELKRKEIEKVKSEAAERKRNEAERERIEAVVEKLLKEESNKIAAERKRIESEKKKKYEKTSKTSSIVITCNAQYGEIYLAKVKNKSSKPKWTIKKKLPFTEDGLEPGLYYLKLCWNSNYGDLCSKVDTVELKEGMLTRLKGYIDQISGTLHREAKGPTWTSKFEKKE